MRFDEEYIHGLLDFLRRAENLKSTLRTAWTASGRQESSAEHSWRLCLFAMLASKQYPDLDTTKLLKMCIVHDLGEAIHGDIPAPEQVASKSGQERSDMLDLMRPLPDEMREEILSLWDEYESAETQESRLVKALDKLETLLQHTQGLSHPDVDYAFDLGYGIAYTDLDAFVRALRAAADAETEYCLYSRQRNMR